MDYWTPINRGDTLGNPFTQSGASQLPVTFGRSAKPCRSGLLTRLVKPLRQSPRPVAARFPQEDPRSTEFLGRTTDFSVRGI